MRAGTVCTSSAKHDPRAAPFAGLIGVVASYNYVLPLAAIMKQGQKHHQANECRSVRTPVQLRTSQLRFFSLPPRTTRALCAGSMDVS